MLGSTIEVVLTAYLGMFFPKKEIGQQNTFFQLGKL
jgi:hypothetical protein